MRKLAHDGERLPLAAGADDRHRRRRRAALRAREEGDHRAPLGIVHRDVSPSNVVVTYDGGVKVVDFGIAKMAADPRAVEALRAQGQARVHVARAVHSEPIDRRSDLFSLGIVLYEITTHTRLFKGQTEVRHHAHGARRRRSRRRRRTIPTIRPSSSAIVMRALEKDPDKRYASARDLQLELEAFARDRRLHISSAGLADWMETSFGPKREIWHSLPAPAAPPPSAAPAPAVSEPATRIVAHVAVTKSDPATGSASGGELRHAGHPVAARATTRDAVVDTVGGCHRRRHRGAGGRGRGCGSAVATRPRRRRSRRGARPARRSSCWSPSVARSPSSPELPLRR